MVDKLEDVVTTLKKLNTKVNYVVTCTLALNEKLDEV